MKKALIIIAIAVAVLGAGYYIQKKNSPQKQEPVNDETGNGNGNLGVDEPGNSEPGNQGEVTSGTTGAMPKLRVSLNSATISRNGNFSAQ